MTPAQRKQVEKALHDAKRALLEKPKLEVEKNRVDDARAGGDDDAQPLAEMGQVIASNRNRNDAALAKRIDAALARLKSDPDDFGNCGDCGDPLPFKRLLAMPWAELCVECQTAKDGPKRTTRKSLTDFVS